MPEVKFSLFENTKGYLSKKLTLTEDGVLHKSASAALYQGTFKTATVDWVTDFGNFISTLTPKQALVHGVCTRLGADNQALEEGRVVKNIAEWNPKNGVISRTSENFGYHGTGVRNGSVNYTPFECSTPNLTMLDMDDIPKGMTVDDIIAQVLTDLPVIQTLGCWAYPSAGSFIYDGDKQLTGLSGLHIYVALPQTIKVADFKTYVDVTLWNKGHGTIFITKSGQRLKRTYVDLSVFMPERLDFISGGVCEGTLSQRRPAPVFYGALEGEELPTQLFTSFDIAEAEKRKTGAYNGARFEAEKVKGVFTNTLASKAGLGQSDAKKLVEFVYAGKIGGSHPIHMDDGSQIPAWKIIFHHTEYNKRTCADPVEPEYGGEADGYGVNKAICYTAGMGKATIFSHAHGGTSWNIVIDYMAAKQVLELYSEGDLMETLGSDWISFLAADELSQGDRERLFDIIKARQNISKEQIKAMFDSSAMAVGNVELEEALHELNEHYAVISTKGKVRIVTETFEPDMMTHSLELMSKFDFLLLHENHFIYTWEKGKRKKLKIAQAWLEWEFREQFKGFIFDPTKPNKYDGFLNLFKGYAVPNRAIKARKCKGKFCDGKGCISWFVNGGWDSCEYGKTHWTDQWGCWKGKGREAEVDRATANVQFWLRHIFEVIAHGDKDLFTWCLDWFTDIIQNPGGDRPGTSLAVQGKKGTGKGAIFNTIQKLFGQHSFHTSDMKELVGNFNAHLQRVVFLFSDEAIFSGDKAAEGTLKRLITEDTINITFKGYDTFKVPNRLRIGISSNEHWMVPASVDERRFCVTKAWDGRRVDNDWFDRVYKPSLEDLLEELLQHKITSDLRTIPVTDELKNQIIQSQDIATEFYNTLHELKPEWFMGVPVKGSDVWDVFEENYRHAHGFGYYTKTKLSRRLCDMNELDERRSFRFDGVVAKGVIFARREMEDEEGMENA
ncbi:MAG: DUF5906 domain-containing protein [Spirochaetales bacterium]|jgi:hypothetical protein|nr:DUF5906 domain-containing protein [Spirochaetales bacterium]